MRFTVDTNVLVYAVDRDAGDKRLIAQEILKRGAWLEKSEMILTAQSLGEFLNVVRRKNAAGLGDAIAQVERWTLLFPIIATVPQHIVLAAHMAIKYRLQFWDCVIWQAARSDRAALFVTEDLQDGLSLDGMTVLNPFNESNSVALAGILEKS